MRTFVWSKTDNFEKKSAHITATIQVFSGQAKACYIISAAYGVAFLDPNITHFQNHF